MIKYNNSIINDWYYNASDIIKVYHNNAVCYYKITSSGGTTAQTPCFAVVDDISQYQETEFIDVFNLADEKWYKLNNLSQYEEYGLYGSGRTITHYEGKLTIDDGYEYIYSGGSWNNVGEVSGSTATLPNVPFTVNYNAKNYDANTKTFAKTQGQLADTDVTITTGTPTFNGTYVTVETSTRGVISGYQTYFNRTDSNPNLTIISKQMTDGVNCHLFANRTSNYNWMYRPYYNELTLHGTSEQGSVAVTTQPVIESVRVDSNRLATYNNYTDNTTSTYSNFSYGSTNTSGTALFAGYTTTTGEWFAGDFYWIYMAQATLTDEQVQQVIAYNEGGEIAIYPMYYTEKSAPEDDVVFSDMTEAEAYQCPWVGMTGVIADTDYIFDENYDWVTKYGLFEVSGEYVCDLGNKYQQMEEKIRNVDDSWSSQTPPVYEKGDLIESASTDCRTTSLDYLRFVSRGSGTFTFFANRSTSANSLSYSLDSGVTWTSLENGSATPTVAANSTVMWKGENLTIVQGGGIGTFSSTTQFDVEGNIMSLLYGDSFEGQTNLSGKDTVFQNLFSGCTTVINAENLSLPATTLSNNCYTNMFNRCSNITTAPTILPATTLSSGCYYNMFLRCSKLVTAPMLPAETLTTDCYNQMFNSCTKLNNITCLATNISASGCTNSWVASIASRGTFTKAANMSSWPRGTSGIPNNWTVQDYQT